MALPAPIRIASTRRDIPLLDVTSLHNGARSWCLALFRSMTDTEATGTLGGVRDPASVWNILRTCDGNAVLAGNNWVNLAAVVGGYNGNAHSWAVMENPALGYQFCIDINAPTGQGFRFVMTKIASPFSAGTTINAPISANEFQAGVYATGLGAVTPSIFAGTVGAQSYYFHYSTCEDGQFYALMNRVGQFSFNGFFAVQKTENAHPDDEDNVFMWMQPAQESGRGVPDSITSMGNPNITGRSANGLSVWGEGGGGRYMAFGGTTFGGSERKDFLRDQYPALKIEIFSVQGTALSGHRGNFVDVWCVAIATARIGQVYPGFLAPEYVLANDFLIPFVGGPPTM